MSNALRWLGIVYLIVAIIVAIAIIYNYGTIEVGVYYTHTETNILAVGCSVGIVFQAVLVLCATCGLAQVMDKCDEITEKLGMVNVAKETDNTDNQEHGEE